MRRSLRFTVYGLRFTVYSLRFTVYGLQMITWQAILIAGMVFASCTQRVENPIPADEFPTIYPDYIGVTIPAEIAPLNFNVQCSMLNAQCSMLNAQCSMVNGQWSMVNG